MSCLLIAVTSVSFVSLICLSFPLFSSCSICFFAPLGEDQVPSVWSCEPSCGTLCPQHRTAQNQPFSKETSQGNTIWNFFQKLGDFIAIFQCFSWCYCSFVLRAYNETLLSLNSAVMHSCRFTVYVCSHSMHVTTFFCTFQVWMFCHIITVWLTVTAAFESPSPPVPSSNKRSHIFTQD